MSAQIFSFLRQETIIQKLRAAEAEIYAVVLQEEDDEACADLMSVIEKLQEIILRIQGPL